MKGSVVIMEMNMFLDVCFGICILIIITLLIRRIISKRKIDRVTFYSMESTGDSGVSLTDKVVKLYFDFLCTSRRYLKRVDYFNKKAKKYEKYIKYKYRKYLTPIDFITNKLVIMVVFVLLVLLSSIFTTKISLFVLVIDAIIGYYLLDIYLFIYYRRQTKLIDNELLRAIIIMNNAFKAGKSTFQALKIASLELDDPISDEFKKMYLDMKYGLSVDTVFDRFAKRVNLEEATFLSSSLTILNKTGGNIVLVFSSIEKNLFDKKKLDEEMKNISASPRMVVMVLFFVPIVFTLIIYLLNPDYFDPLFECTLGHMIIGIIVLMFIIYVLLLNRILKIDE